MAELAAQKIATQKEKPYGMDVYIRRSSFVFHPAVDLPFFAPQKTAGLADRWRPLVHETANVVSSAFGGDWVPYSPQKVVQISFIQVTPFIQL
jgi:hypothetical protein